MIFDLLGAAGLNGLRIRRRGWFSVASSRLLNPLLDSLQLPAVDRQESPTVLLVEFDACQLDHRHSGDDGELQRSHVMQTLLLEERDLLIHNRAKNGHHRHSNEPVQPLLPDPA